MSKKILFYFIIIGILVLTLFFFRKYPQWRSLDNNLVLNGGFELGYRHWQKSGNGVNYLQNDQDGTKLHLSCPKENLFSVMTQEIPVEKYHPLMKLSCLALAEVKNPDIALWKKPVIFLVCKDYLDKILWRELKVIKLFENSSHINKIDKVVKIPEYAKKIVVAAEIDGSVSSMDIDNIELIRVEREPGTKFLINLLIFMNFGIFSCLYFILPDEKGKNLVAALAIIIVIGVLLPDESLKNFMRLIPGMSGNSHELIQAANPMSLSNNPFITNDSMLYVVKKFTHFAMFFVFTMASGLVYKHYSIVYLIMNLLLFGCFSELIQFFTIDRTPEFNGLIMNFFGIAFGIACCILFIKLNYMYTKRKSENVK